MQSRTGDSGDSSNVKMMVRVQREWRRYSLGALALAFAAGAMGCSGKNVTRTVSDAQLSALPTLKVSDGRLVCTALGGDQCPLHSAIANWLGKDRVAVWEPGRLIMILDAKSPNGRELGAVGQTPGHYLYVTAVGPYEGAIGVIDLQRLKLIRFKDDGTFDREDNIPRPGANAAPGFVGATPVLQTIGATPASDTAHMTLDVLDSYGQQSGKRVLDVPVRWLRISSDTAIGHSPLFPASPRYAIDVDRSIIWTPSDSFFVQRRSFDGTVRWTLTSDRRGTPVTPTDISARLDEISRNAPKGLLSPEQLDSMVAHTAKDLPVFSGIVLEPGGRMLLVGEILASRDSTQYLMVDPDGTPTHRFALPSRTNPLVLSGDSLLVHRPTEGEPWELRWLKLGK